MKQYPLFRQRLSKSDKTKFSYELKNKVKVLTLKNKLLMKEGTHNGKFYPAAELRDADIANQNFGLYMEHQDGADTWIGEVIPRYFDDGEKAWKGDVVIVDDEVAKKQMYGAKWGLSPTVDVDVIEGDKGPTATNPQFVSWSLVLDPAVQETMLNTKLKNLRGENAMEDLAKKKKKKKDEEEEMSLKELQKTHADTLAELETLKEEKMKRECSELADSEIQWGRITEEMKEARIKELMEMSEETRAMLKTEHDWVIKQLELDKEENVGKGGEYPAPKDKKKKKKYPYPGPEKRKLSRENRQMLARMKGEEWGVTEGDREMLAFMRERQDRDTIYPGGAK